MRMLSFDNVDPIRRQIQTVTRRLRWQRLQPGALFQPVVHGLQRVETIGGPIRVVHVSREPLNTVTQMEVRLEGCNITPRMFVRWFCWEHECDEAVIVTRIEFRYEEPLRLAELTV